MLKPSDPDVNPMPNQKGYINSIKPNHQSSVSLSLSLSGKNL